MTIAMFLTLALLAQAPPAAPATAPASEARPIAPEFIATIQKSEQAMDALKQFSVTARLVSSLEGPGMKQGSTSTQTITARRPGKVLIKADWGQFGESAERPQLRVLLDGTRLTTFFVPSRLVSFHEGKDAAEELAGEAIIASTLESSGLHVLTMPEMAKFVLAHTEEAKLAGTEAIDGIECRKFEVAFGGMRLNLWLGPESQPLLRKLSETTILTSDGKGQLTSSRTSVLSWSVDKEIPDSEFQLAVPDKSTRVENILQALSEPPKKPVQGRPLPETMLTDHKGQSVRPSAWKGMQVTLVFWASWMNNTEETLKYAAKLNEAKKPEEMVYLVNAGESPAKIADMLRSVKGLPDCIFDAEEDLLIYLSLKAIPSVVVLNNDNTVKSMTTGLPAN